MKRVLGHGQFQNFYLGEAQGWSASWKRRLEELCLKYAFAQHLYNQDRFDYSAVTSNTQHAHISELKNSKNVGDLDNSVFRFFSLFTVSYRSR